MFDEGHFERTFPALEVLDLSDIYEGIDIGALNVFIETQPSLNTVVAIGITKINQSKVSKRLKNFLTIRWERVLMTVTLATCFFKYLKCKTISINASNTNSNTHVLILYFNSY